MDASCSSASNRSIIIYYKFNKMKEKVTLVVVDFQYDFCLLGAPLYVPFSEFGTRRRYSFNVQDEVIKYIKEHSIYCTGTSNCYFAMKYDMKMMGTHPHEWFMFHGAMYGYKQANYMALENWTNAYDGDLAG